MNKGKMGAIFTGYHRLTVQDLGDFLHYLLVAQLFGDVVDIHSHFGIDIVLIGRQVALVIRSLVSVTTARTLRSRVLAGRQPLLVNWLHSSS